MCSVTDDEASSIASGPSYNRKPPFQESDANMSLTSEDSLVFQTYSANSSNKLFGPSRNQRSNISTITSVSQKTFSGYCSDDSADRSRCKRT